MKEAFQRYLESLLKGYYVHCEEYCARLIFPVTENRSCKREWTLWAEASPYEYEKAKYEGTLYFLMNSDTPSSGETSVLFARSLKHVAFIGENSMGCNTFGNVGKYVLTFSNIILRVPSMINLCKNPDDCAEGKGFTPDFWVDSSDVQRETIRWIKNQESYLPKLF